MDNSSADIKSQTHHNSSESVPDQRLQPVTTDKKPKMSKKSGSCFHFLHHFSACLAVAYLYKRYFKQEEREKKSCEPKVKKPRWENRTDAVLVFLAWSATCTKNQPASSVAAFRRTYRWKIHTCNHARLSALTLQEIKLMKCPNYA